MNIFYVGSCRYKYDFTYFFPPRLHTTKEIINFLQQLSNNTLQFRDNEEFGNALSANLRDMSNEFLKHNTLLDCKIFAMEICSRKVAYYNRSTTPMNASTMQMHKIDKTKYRIHKQSDSEIRDDIILIKNLLADKFNIHHIIIIPHINLPLSSTGLVIPDRNSLYRLLCSFKDIAYIIDITTSLIEKLPSPLFMETIMPEANHYTTTSNAIVKEILNLEKTKLAEILLIKKSG